MSGIRDFMTEHHRHCDDILAEAEQAVAGGDPAATRAAFERFRDAMQAHFASEEETLFPAFETATGMRSGPTQVMRMEHDQMRALFTEAETALAEGCLDDYAGIAGTLLIMMQQHNMKEENILYPMCDEHLAAEAPALVGRLAAGCGAA